MSYCSSPTNTIDSASPANLSDSANPAKLFDPTNPGAQKVLDTTTIRGGASRCGGGWR